MIIKIIDIEKEFKNKESEIPKIFDYINQIINEKNIFLKSMEIDGIEIYDNFYEYFLDKMESINIIEIKIQTLNQLIDDVIYDSWEYIVKAIPLIERLSVSFKKNPTEKSWQELGNLFSGIEWILETYRNIDQYKNLSELVPNYYIWNEYVVELEKLKQALPDFFEAINNKDTILIGDVLEYEINPLFESISEKLNKLAKKDVNNQNAN
ncbi:hypothetical protein [Acetoanaerobium noterae]|uniref:hypothetical protein n=1 Tax=Acetoanaerobium noterae TaxID=745369 RepID=UPI003242158B